MVVFFNTSDLSTDLIDPKAEIDEEVTTVEDLIVDDLEFSVSSNVSKSRRMSSEISGIGSNSGT